MTREAAGGALWRDPPTSVHRSLLPVRGYLIEVAANDYRLTTDAQSATHGFVDRGGSAVLDLEIVPLAELDGSVRLAAVGDTFHVYG